ncbi:MAG TPA: protein-glutamate O-methyltransferase CheR [Armatimonadota bacterium]|jgi:chemotaxis protein methyltransferase CheR
MAALLSLDEYEQLCRGLSRLWQVDLRGYAPGQLQRRLANMMTRAGAGSGAEFLAQLQADSALAADYRDRFTINVTEFFRDRRPFARLEARLAELHREQPIKRIWSAACSLGMEPFSVAMLMSELAPVGLWRIAATDLDPLALARARRAEYAPEELQGVSPERLARFFRPAAEGHEVQPALRRRVDFAELDLLKPLGRQPRSCDLILCRNVTIYFTPAAKEQVHALLSASLRPGGLLFVGATERLAAAPAVGLRQLEPALYQKEWA